MIRLYTSNLSICWIRYCMDCSLDLDSCLSAPCETGARCINLMGNDSYACMCPPGFEGSNCRENINDCAPVNPCVNGGTCIVSASRSPHLVCTALGMHFMPYFSLILGFGLRVQLALVLFSTWWWMIEFFHCRISLLTTAAIVFLALRMRTALLTSMSAKEPAAL